MPTYYKLSKIDKLFIEWAYYSNRGESVSAYSRRIKLDKAVNE